ncbi:hypothetical protein T440DRAFT_461703 [Plenodomus tracheiphilus IPT5]|uniref:Uncharacterized protein n=1 Tax=Plenodomus tracheiphilus IPT5 TaxID=1408161 RepID=A0A6A7AR72_9PLEO|nr:hypothetical protein T440DRAFT_461703 [Plenodomus tracheiphilus IPT5]
MFARIATRAAFAGKRFNSSSSSSTTARVMQMAAQAERPTATEFAVPALWAACGVLTFTAWNRMSERSAGDNVEKLLIV